MTSNLDALAKDIKDATDLAALCDAANAFRRACVGVAADGYDLDQEHELRARGVDLTSLKTFGGKEPHDTVGVWSWSENELLVSDENGQMEIVSRDDES